MYHLTNSYCTNCGRTGHITRLCKDPVISIGIIVFKMINDEPHLIMIQRKYSMCFVEFLRGRYNINNLTYLITLINGMTDKEIIDLETKTFEILWNELWINNDHKNYKNDFFTAKEKFVQINIKELIEKKSEKYETPEWGFPKGRRNYKEKDIDCAIREFCEETGLEKNDFEIIQNIIPIKEDYIGNNSVRYRHIYYIAKIKSASKNKHLYVDPNNKDQCIEIGDISWLDKKECIQKIRETDILKKNIIENICEFLIKLNNNFYLKSLHIEDKIKNVNKY